MPITAARADEDEEEEVPLAFPVLEGLALLLPRICDGIDDTVERSVRAMLGRYSRCPTD